MKVGTKWQQSIPATEESELVASKEELEITRENNAGNKGKSHAEERVVRFSGQKAAMKVGTDCRSTRATGEGRHKMTAISPYLQLRKASW